SFVQLNSVLIMGSLGIVLLLGITISFHLIATMWSVYGIDPSWIKGRDAGTVTVADISGPTSWIGVAVIVLTDFGLSMSLIYFCEKKTRTGVLKGA
ncbi:hypothetical protein R3Q06_33695, partial [Rhodococcus erythropolis]|uniref:hypothetical protein n=1 Tax=Rhodococcus erythropolis TaxID=1833 RepID=UPI002948CCB6